MSDSLGNLRNVQLHCVKIVEEIDYLCRKHGIKYSLTGGSVIGAYLYEGFIPWDDDIDIMMTRDNYEKFLKVCENELPERYSVENYENKRDKKILFTKVVDEKTTVVELKQDGRKIVGGVFVDITVFDKIPKAKMKKAWFFILAKVIQGCRNRGYERVTSLRVVAKNICIFCEKPFAEQVHRYIKGKFIAARKREYDYAELMAGIPIAYDKVLFEEYSDIFFEGKKFMIVKDYMSYLETRYGRREFYKEQRQGDAPHHLVFADCNISYHDYLANAEKRAVEDKEYK